MGGPTAGRGGGREPRELARLAFRKLVYRRTLLGRWSVRAGDVAAPDDVDDLVIELLGPDRFDEVEGTNPHLLPSDLVDLRLQRTTCIVARDGGRIVASTWMTSGTVLVHELHRRLEVPSHEHFSCRSYVAESHRGRHLLGRLVRAYARQLDDDDELWGLVYPWNEASIRSLESIGWRRDGSEWTRFVGDRPIGGSRRHPPRPPLTRRPRGVDGPPPPLPPCVLVAGESIGGTLQAARSLGRAGVPVVVVTLGPGAAVHRRSRFVTAAIDLADAHPSDLAAALAPHVAGAEAVPVLPLSDRAVDLLDRSRDVLPPQLRLALPDHDHVAPLLDKPSAMALAAEAGLAVPPWVAIRSPADAHRADDLRLPVIVRPTGWDTTGAHYFKFTVARTPAELRRDLAGVLAGGGQVVAQEYEEAPEDAVELAIVWRSCDGTATEVATGRKRRAASAAGGVMAWGEAVDLPDVAALATAFLDRAGFVGVGGLEVIRTGGRLWFVEFNPRLESIHFLAATAGIDTVLLAYQDLAFGQRPATGARAQQAAAWVGSAWFDRVRRHPDDWRLLVRERRAFGRRRHRTRAVWDPRDPLPSLVLVGRLVARALRGPASGAGG